MIQRHLDSVFVALNIKKKFYLKLFLKQLVTTTIYIYIRKKIQLN